MSEPLVGSVIANCWRHGQLERHPTESSGLDTDAAPALSAKDFRQNTLLHFLRTKVNDRRGRNVDADEKTLRDTVGTETGVLVARDELVELVDLLVLDSRNAGEIGGKVLVDLRGLLKGEETEFTPLLVGLVRHEFALVPFLRVRREVGIDLLAEVLGERKVRLVVEAMKLNVSIGRSNSWQPLSDRPLVSQSASHSPKPTGYTSPASTSGRQKATFRP